MTDSRPGPTPSNAPESPRRTFTVSLWGASQAGKTTALATYLGHYRPDWIEREDGASRQHARQLTDIWRSLQGNRLPAGTRAAQHYVFKSRYGRVLQFRDMMGGNAQGALDQNEDADALVRSDAAMLFVEWPRSREGIHVAQVALGELPAERPAALVVTKCEGYLTPAEFARLALDPIRFGRERSDLVPADLVDLFERVVEHFLDAAVFPISVYGWNGERPAQFCDEFGRLVPWRIQPAQVNRPFEYVLARLPGGKR